MSEQTKPWTRLECVEFLVTTWSAYPVRLAQLPDVEQLRFAQQQGYARTQNLLAHFGASMEETLRVMRPATWRRAPRRVARPTTCKAA